MVLVNVIQTYLQFWRYFTILCSYNSLCLQITSDESKIWKKRSRWLHLNFNILSETFLDFVYIYLVLEIKNTVNLIKSELCELFKPEKLYGMVYIANFTITLIQMVSIFQSMETHGCDVARSWIL